jgi:hypothetical protein
MAVRFCACAGAASHGVQLLHPETAATWEVLQLFESLIHRSRCNAYNFTQALEHITDPWRLLNVPVSSALWFVGAN